MPFDIHAKNFFATYPQCTLEHDLIHNFFLDLNPTYLISSKESHADGHFHYHVAVGFNNKTRLRSAGCWDVEGFHPNIQASRNIKSVIEYVRKDGDVKEFGDVPTTKRTWADALAKSTTSTEFMDAVKEVSPRDFILNHEKLEYFTAKQFAKAPIAVHIYDSTEFEIPEKLQDWCGEVGLPMGPRLVSKLFLERRTASSCL